MLVALSLLAAPADACGGFVCDQILPVVQEAERIVFDIQDGVVDMHVQVFYEGPAEEFAWILPVPAEPTLFPSQPELFDLVDSATTPTFQVNRRDEGQCAADAPNLGCGAQVALLSADVPLPAAPHVSSRDRLGPYEILTLRADDEQILLDYLQDSGFDLPDTLLPLLAPYVAANAHFVALRLAKDADAGDIRPLGLRYEGTQAAIPIQLTALAASDDMPLEVFVFAEQRAVPRSYLHVEINDAAIDWLGFPSGSYLDVLSRAADEAGGHAFATEFYGEPPDLARFSWTIDVEALRSALTPGEWVEAIRLQNIPQDAFTQLAVLDALGGPEDADPEAFMDCPTCFEGWDPAAFDATDATDVLDEQVLQYLDRIEQLEERKQLTRLTSTLDVAEMTVDPVFVLNPDVSGESHYISNVRTVDLVTECHNRRSRWSSPRRLELADGRVIRIPSDNRLRNQGLSVQEFLADQRELAAQVVVDFSEVGPGQPLVDLTPELTQLAEISNRQVAGPCRPPPAPRIRGAARRGCWPSQA